MRLLNIDTLDFREFNSDNTPEYVVTSHRWTDNEASYKDVLKRRNKNSHGWKKITKLCAFLSQLRKHDREHRRRSTPQWIWMDTCCINQNSSAEVSESINSMWEWYTQSAYCIAYLHDVRPLQSGRDAVLYDFRRSEWHERGWTLQELLAPKCVIFLNSYYEIIGHKSSEHYACDLSETELDKYIAEITGIPQDVLCDFVKHRDSLGRDVRMAWAANRRTTKVEDAAYCLLGIFDVHLPLIYGEGQRNAMKRLEQEIIKREAEQYDSIDGFYFAPNSYLADARDKRRVLQDSPPAEESHAELNEHVSDRDLCLMCSELLLDPVTTSCHHTLCESCIVTDEGINMVIVPLESRGEAGGDAASTNYRALQRCPLCGTVGMHRLLAMPDISLTEDLRSRYPQTYARRTSEKMQMRADMQTMIIHTGNWHELRGPHRHDWTFFVKLSQTYIVEEVQMDLHESFPEPHVVLKKPPYTLHGGGWGYFTIDISILLKPGYSWVSSNARVANDGTARKLKLEWTLDFESFGGKGAMGRCKVQVRKETRQAMQRMMSPEQSSSRVQRASTFDSDDIDVVL
jgi:hypothetical protein